MFGTSFDLVGETPAVQSLLRRMEQGGVLSLGGICPSGQPFLAALLRRLRPHLPIVVVTDSLKSQEALQQDLETWLHGNADHGESFERQKRRAPHDKAAQSHSSPLFYPAWEILPHEDRLPHADVISERLQTLLALAASPPEQGRCAPIINTSVTALLQRTFAPAALARQTRTLTRGQQFNLLDLIEWLEDQGYESEVRVTKKGEISLRGGIVDVFPLPSPWPVRLEFFGNDLESLRTFDPASQVSREEIAGITLPPAGELGILRAKVSQPRDSSSEPLLGSLLDYLPANTLFLLCEPSLLEDHASNYAKDVPADDPFFFPWPEWVAALSRRASTVLRIEESETPDSNEADPTELLRIASLEAFRPLTDRVQDPLVAESQRREFFSQLHRWLRQDYAVTVFCNNDGERQRFEEIWQDYGLAGSQTESNPAAAGPARGHAAGDDRRPATHLGTLSRGFLMEQARQVVVTDAEIFGRYRVQRPRRLRSPHAPALRSALDIDFSELEEGDCVVHLQHGIGRYVGLQAMPGSASRSGQAAEECLVIEYAAPDANLPAPRLYVPVSEAHLVSKYVGAGKARPPLNTLGGTRWAKTKAQAERAVHNLAGEMLAIQAARESQPGHAFAPDSAWQREFESAFVFEETPDQLRAIAETKTDMERPKPMDRLICGDVGFGKTEVAIRAVFKAVMDGRQVAVLVPTTVLAQQHYNTFRERMADYPVRIELLSRFRTRRQQQKIIPGLAAGSVDIVIGTHRLVQKDIAFKDLGLVVIDEEQRFGVPHKERFKQLRRLVDVLTLSATPIPRTLYLALTGARDMSTIQTPPHDRLPVETIVTQYDERVLRDAILREIARDGQVFFLHNRVATIDVMADKLRTLVPDARIVVGHGQMHADDLEEVMTRFVNGEANVLLSTTIIESGLDIPNANTIIIDRADRFGLSDLYQLRGRVGRYKHQAYAYLVIPRHARLLTDARKRISALKQYSTLGSGFKIAMRDLEIRGAGNLLGAEQSGHITAVGFELYCKLLKHSVAHLKGEKVTQLAHVEMRVDFLTTSAVQFPAANAVNEAGEGGKQRPKARKRQARDFEINVPRESWSYSEDFAVLSSEEERAQEAPLPVPQASACVPVSYVSDPVQRIEVYRKLAQAAELADLDALQRELKDRFGPLPAPVTLLMLATQLKLLAAARGVTAIETKGDKVMLTRNGDYIMVGGKFPRLVTAQPKTRLNEIRKLLMALQPPASLAPGQRGV